MAVTTRDYPPRRLPGHVLINLGLAAGVWGVGVALTARSLPLEGLGPALPWAAAVGVQLLLSAGQSNLRTLGLSAGRWPFLVFTLADVALNAAGLLMAFGGLQSLEVCALFAVRAALTGAGLWQLAAALLVGVLIAAAPEQMVRDALTHPRGRDGE